MRKLKFVWLVLAGLIVGAGGFSGLSFAEEAVVELGEVVVTATRVERLITDIPASVTVITREEIEKTYAKTVDDFLRREVGVQVRRLEGLASSCGVAVRMRGTGGWTGRVLILKDGVPLNTRYTGGVPFLNVLSIQDIERIEIVRGAASAIHGSAALGGVINIITRRADIGLSGDVSMEAGSFDTEIGSLGLRYGAGNFALRFAVERKQGSGHKSRYPWDPTDQGWRLTETELTQISLGGDLWLGESLLKVDFDNFRQDRLAARRDQWDTSRETNKYRASWETPLFGFGEETVFSLKGYYFDEDRISISHRINPDTREHDIFRHRTVIPTSDYGIMSQISTVLGNHRLVAGVDFSGASADRHQKFAPPRKDTRFEGEQRLYAVFVNNEMHLGERVILSAGLRYDHWENIGGRFLLDGAWKEIPKVTDSAISPRGGIVYKLNEDTRLRASVGTGFRAPSLFHMYHTGPCPTFDFRAGNPELKPERLDWSYDVGIEMQPHENFNLSLTFYQSRLSDFLAFVTHPAGDPDIPDWVVGVAPGLDVRQKINIGEMDIHGVEAELDFRFNERWSAFVNHTFNVSKIREHEIAPAYEGNYLCWSPRHISVLGFTYDNPRLFTLSLDITSTGSRFERLRNEVKVPGFHMVNMRASRELFEGMEAFINVENLTDEEWRGSRWVNVGVPFNFLVGGRFTF